VRNILITGATGGIGSSIVESLAGEGNELFLQYAHEYKKQEKENHFKKLPGKINFLKADLTHEGQIKEMLDLVLEKGGAEIFIHCVALPLEMTEVIKKDWADYEKHISIQVKSFFLITKQLLPGMINNKKGKIVSILTDAASGRPPAKMSDYVTAKYALQGFTKCLAVEYGKFNITANCVSPGLTDTTLTKELPSKLKEVVAFQTPLQRISTPKDVAGVVKFLCSEDACYITGENILLNGGILMR